MIKSRKSIEGLMPYIPGRPIEDVQREFGLSDVVKLASNENPYGAPASAINAVQSSLLNVCLYPDGSCFKLREALSKKHSINMDNFVIGAGADELISLIADAFIETGDDIITAELTFGQYAAAALAMGGNAVLTPMKNSGYDLDAVLKAITDKTKIIFIANPNNPTGTLICDEEKTAFLDAVPENILVVFDEAYQEYVENKGFTSSVPLVLKYSNLIVLKTFSKIYGLASLRVGYGVMHEEYASSINKIRKPFNVSIPAQQAALAALAEKEFVAEANRRNIEVKNYCYKKLDELGISYIKSETNFIAMDSPIDCAEAFQGLMKKGYIVRPNAFGMKDKLRVTFGTMEQMEGFFEVLKSL